MASSLLVASQISAIFSSSQAEVIDVQTSRRDAPLPLSPKSSDPPADHATYASLIFTERTGTIALRVVDGGLTIELISLTTELPPIRFVFPSVILPNPGIFPFEDRERGLHEIHILVVTEGGSVFRLVLPASGDYRLWRQAFTRNWCREYHVKHGSGRLSGIVQVQGHYLIGIGMKDGSMLRLDADAIGSEVEEDVWEENYFGQTSLLSSFASFLNTSKPGEEQEFVSMASHAQPTDNGALLTLSRDRTLRIWSEGGCSSARTLPMIAGVASTTPGPRVRASSQAPAALLETGPQNLIRLLNVISPDLRTETPWCIVFNPTPSSTTSGGFFHIFQMTTDDKFVGAETSINCPLSTSHCTLQDFCVTDTILYALWDKQGRSSIEKIYVDINHTSAGAVDGAVWQVASYAAEPELTPAYLDQLLLSPGSMTDHLLTAIMKPGTFSPLTLRTAIEQYAEACLSLPGHPPLPLRTTYSTLHERIASVVGCTVVLAQDPQTGVVQHDRYRQALKRDWEGFIARCRGIERSARRPLSITVLKSGDVIFLERERVGKPAGEDHALQLHRCLLQAVPVDGPYALCEMIWRLREHLSASKLADLESRVIDIVREEIQFPFSDLILDQAQRMDLQGQIDEGFASWLTGRVASLEDLDVAVRSVLDLLGGFDRAVKREEDEVALLLPVTNTDWTRSLAFHYAAATIEARYDLAIALIGIVFFLSTEEMAIWDPALLAEILAVFRGIALLRLVARQPGAHPSASAASSFQFNADDIAARMGNMSMGATRRSSTPFVPTYSLMHQLLAQSMNGVDPAAASHHFMDSCGLMQSTSPAFATSLEVHFCDRLRVMGYHGFCQQILSWLPRTPGATYVMARSKLDIGMADEAAHLFALVAGSFEDEGAVMQDDVDALAAVLPGSQMLVSDFDFYVEIAALFQKASETRWEAHFMQLALTVAPRGVDLTPIWQRMIKGYIDLHQWDDAYTGIMSMSIETLKRDLIVNLVSRMCEENAVDKLMSFNFVGLVKEVEEALAFKARNARPLSRPYYSRILYSWYVGKNDYRNGALVMYQRGRKLGDERVGTKQMVELADQQREAYALALNALSLLDEKNAWFVFPVMSQDRNETRRKTLCRYIPETKFEEGIRDAEYINIDKIKRDIAHLTARNDIIRRDPSLLTIGGDQLSPESIVMRLANAAQYSSALEVARSLKVDMTLIFESLTEQCGKLSRSVMADLVTNENLSNWLLSDKITSWPGTPADRGWRFLHQSLERYDGLKTGWRYHLAALRIILAYNRSAAPPPWLEATLEEHRPEDLIRVYFSYENWEATLSYSLRLLRKTDNYLRRVTPEFAMSSWLPYSLLDQVVEALRDRIDLPPRARALHTELDTELSNHVKRMKAYQFKS